MPSPKFGATLPQCNVAPEGARVCEYFRRLCIPGYDPGVAFAHPFGKCRVDLRLYRAVGLVVVGCAGCCHVKLPPLRLAAYVIPRSELLRYGAGRSRESSAEFRGEFK